MKYILLGLIKFYQMIPGPWHNKCRYIPSCSNYAIEAIINYGLVKGSIMSIKRILKCNPLFKSGFDPVKKKENWYEKNHNIFNDYNYIIYK